VSDDIENRPVWDENIAELQRKGDAGRRLGAVAPRGPVCDRPGLQGGDVAEVAVFEHGIVAVPLLSYSRPSALALANCPVRRIRNCGVSPAATL